MAYNMNNAVDYAVALLNKKTGEKEGRIIGYYTKGGTFHVNVDLYVGNSFDGLYHHGEGRAGGYGYDKVSSAISDALAKADIGKGDLELRGSCARFTSSEYSSDEVERIAREQKAIPVYGGSGNHEQAFSIFFRYEVIYT